jgi:hypothetical protein
MVAKGQVIELNPAPREPEHSDGDSSADADKLYWLLGQYLNTTDFWERQGWLVRLMREAE